jgi:plastocyanin
MRASFSFVVILTAAISASRCGGGDSGGSGTPTTPGTNTPTPLTISIVGTNGNKSYVPNPIPTSAGEQVVFKNNDTIQTHHIVMDDGSIDFGTLAPGASSAAKGVGAGGNFHCANHPSMVGSINGTVAPEPPPGSGDGY